MRTLLYVVLAVASSAVMRADFTYQQTTRITGGTIYGMLRLVPGARDPVVATHLIKGNRMVSLSKNSASVMDLDKETVTEIDFSKKTYSVVTFAQMKQAIEDAAAKVDKKKTEKNVQLSFKVSAKATGETKTISGMNAKEMIFTMTMEGADKDSGNTGAMDIVMDNWMAEVPGYEEVKAFQKRLGEKMGYVFGSGLQQIGMMQPETLKGIEEASKEMGKVDGVAVQTTMKMGAAGTADAMANSKSSAQTQPQEKPDVGAAIGRIAGIGGLGRKKNNDPPQQQAGNQQSAGALMESTTELTSFSSGLVDASKFDVPAGFKQVESNTVKRGR